MSIAIADVGQYFEGYSKLSLFCFPGKASMESLPSSCTTTLEEIETVNIDLDNGAEEYKAKYVILKVITKEDDDFKYIFRARKRAAYHRDVSGPISRDLEEKFGVRCEVGGGGRVLVNVSSKKILVYGYSVDFGKADHSMTVAAIKEVLPEWTVTYSNDGY